MKGMDNMDQRIEKLTIWHREKFGEKAGIKVVSAPGRVEIAGNHTDHNHGRVIAAAVDLDTVAVVSPRDDNAVTLYSEGYQRPFQLNLDTLAPQESEKSTSLGLIRGVAAKMKELGYRIGGFDAVASSRVFKGSGLSSSAAFEVMVCAIFDALYNGFVVEAKERARIAQYAENVYYGKPCGLMDQTASSVGGLVGIDFGGEVAKVTAIQYDFEKAGYYAAVISCGGDHGNLTDEYASIPAEMKSVAKACGKEVLRDVGEEAFYAALPSLKGKVSDRAILRAMHFFDEDKRVPQIIQALQNDDIHTFLKLINASGDSSLALLQNITVAGSPNQEMAICYALATRLTQGRGARRINGGGFAGTILAFVPIDLYDQFEKGMNDVFGQGAVTRLSIRSQGAMIIA